PNPVPPRTVNPSTTTLSPKTVTDRTATPPPSSVIGAADVPDLASVRSVSASAVPVKQIVLPGPAFSRTCAARFASATVPVQGDAFAVPAEGGPPEPVGGGAERGPVDAESTNAQANNTADPARR